METKRLYFLDAVRAFAILMMLQGHFVDTLIDPVYRNLDNPVYAVWNYFRGITAPTFYTITGLVFCYLLFRAQEKGSVKQRLRKGITRGLMLILVGYTLRISFIDWLYGYFNSYFLTIDVLQCIGLSLIIVILFFLLVGTNKVLLGILFFIIGTIMFLCEPLYRTIEFPNLPLAISNYLSKSNGSVFTMLPWFGYVTYGGSIAVLVHRYQNKANFKKITTGLFFGLGLLLIYCSGPFLKWLTSISSIELFTDCANYNYLFTRLGNVFIIFGLFYLIENNTKDSLFSKIGQKTLSIYIIHFMIIYGSYTGFGLKNFFYKSLNPTEVIIGAIIFIVVVCLISFYYVKTNTFVYKYLRRLIGWVKG